MTIIFVNDGGPFTLCFDRSDLELTERIIRNKFEEIKNTKKPILNKSWKCGRFCHYGKTMSEEEPGKTLCEFYKDQGNKMGLDRLVEKFGDSKAYLRYGIGGGRQESTV